MRRREGGREDECFLSEQVNLELKEMFTVIMDNDKSPLESIVGVISFKE